MQKVKSSPLPNREGPGVGGGNNMQSHLLLPPTPNPSLPRRGIFARTDKAGISA